LADMAGKTVIARTVIRLKSFVSFMDGESSRRHLKSAIGMQSQAIRLQMYPLPLGGRISLYWI
jgi:hypothetical protein